MHPSADRDSRPDPNEIAENIASIAHVPATTLAGDHPARTLLTAAASLGLDCYCYASGGERIGTWCAWVLNSRIPLDNEPDRRMATAYALLAITRAVNDAFEADPNPTTNPSTTIAAAAREEETR